MAILTAMSWVELITGVAVGGRCALALACVGWEANSPSQRERGPERAGVGVSPVRVSESPG